MKRRSLIAAAAIFPFVARAADAPLKIGSPAGPFGDILGYAIELAHKQGLEAKKIEFTTGSHQTRRWLRATSTPICSSTFPS